ncbi:hypothetical protein V2J09_013150, partial [Rumex salicifolius]
DKVPFLSVEALHHLHIFIFVLAIVHVSFCVLTVFFGGARIRQWKRWEDAIEKDRYDTEALKPKITHVHQHAFIQEHCVGLGGKSTFLGWMQFHGSVTRADYAALRTSFIMLLLAVGTKLEHVIIQLAQQVAEKHAAIEGELVNAFDIAFFFKIWVLCSSRTLPLYAVVTQMGCQFKRAIFDDHIQAGVLCWAKKVKKKKKKKKDLKILSNSSDKSGVSTATSNSKGVNIELGSSALPSKPLAKDTQPSTVLPCKLRFIALNILSLKDNSHIK